MNIIKRLTSALLILTLMTAGCASGESFAEWILEEPEATTPAPVETPLPTQTPINGEVIIGTSQAPAGWGVLETSTAPLPELTPPPASDNLPVYALQDDGMLRVYLKSLQELSSLNLTLDGVYAVEGDPGFRFARETRLTLTQQQGDLWLDVGGLTINMGPALTLTRHLDGWGEAGGLYIDEAEKHNLYCGDLSVAAGANGLRVMLTIHVEDYLKGVVAYEMSDSFPVEALKAQAVAARTYALKRKQTSGNRDYDLVDTTADQVFKGCDPTLENVAAAVDETRGVVGVWEGGLATCYYSASNGGQTALASQALGNSEADAYLDVRDDPYDLENPRSLESDLTVTAHCEGSESLREMLEAALQPVMAEAGYASGEWAFEAIEAIEPVNPRFEGSRLYDGLAFDLRVLVAESALNRPTPSPAPDGTPTASASPEASPTPEAAGDMSVAPAPEKWVPAENPYRVVLSVFDDIKPNLSLGLNGSDCELISVETVAGIDGSPAFRLVMRRFGHGVGVSQRGAQRMAGAHGMTFLEILNFYYPGMSVQRIHWPESALAALDESKTPVGASRPRPTPLPTPVPLGQPGEGEHISTVMASSLNLREQPTTSAQIVEFLEKGRQVIVSGPEDEQGWVPVRTGDVSGYVKAEYLDVAPQAEE